MNDQPLISVIVPVYNVADYLDQCLQSIVDQTYCQLEILVVDDGSTDDSSTLCDRWAERDERIRVIHQPNGGLSAARNTALDMMNGELVMMVDSDDVLHPKAASILLQTMQTHQADVVIGDYIPFDCKSPNWPKNQDCKSIQYGQQKAILAIFYQHRLTHSAWGRLYQASLFDGIRYPVGKFYEDLAIIYPLLKKCDRVIKINQAVYGYRQRQGSILTTFKPQRTDVVKILEDLEGYISLHDDQYLKAVKSRLLSAYFNILLLSHQDGSNDHSKIKMHCWDGIKRLRYHCLVDGNVRLKNKAGIIASYLGRNFLCNFIGRKYHPNR